MSSPNMRKSLQENLPDGTIINKFICGTVQSTLGVMAFLLVLLFAFALGIAAFEGEREVEENEEFQALMSAVSGLLSEEQLNQLTKFLDRDLVRGVEGFSSFDADSATWSDSSADAFLSATSYTFDLASTIGYGSFTAQTIGGRAISLVCIIVVFPVAVVAYTRFADSIYTAFASVALSSDSNYKKVMKKYDEQGHGYLDIKELHLIFEDLGINVTNEQCEKILAMYDINNDKHLDEYEFRKLCLNLDINLGLLAREYFQVEFALISFCLYNIIFAITFFFVLRGTEDEFSFFESVYFVIVTVSTVGLGDIVPPQRYRALFSLFAFVGVGFTALLFKAVVDEIYTRTDLRKRYLRKNLEPIFEKGKRVSFQVVSESGDERRDNVVEEQDV
eukprot:snap_masked-scaffold_7-processed-gene-0.11-mRNA-1 protein AED:1.00 eAED:1.00 QI:0/-1/0/0/-1/1/1/0/389